jgi:hypothetical protein
VLDSLLDGLEGILGPIISLFHYPMAIGHWSLLKETQVFQNKNSISQTPFDFPLKYESI